MTRINPTDLFNALTPKEKEQVRKVICQLTPCEVSGHKYKSISVVERWFLPPQVKLVCTQCGDTIMR